MKTLTVEITSHHSYRGQPTHAHRRISAISAAHLVIDGSRLDMSGHDSEPFSIQEGDGFGGWIFTRGADGNTHLHVQQILADSATLPADTTETFSSFPAYALGAKSKQQVARSHALENTVDTATAAHVKGWLARLGRASDRWTEANQSAQWAHSLGMGDAWGEPSTEAQARYQNFNSLGRLLGLARRVVKIYEARTYYTGTGTGKPTNLDTAKQIGNFVTMIAQEFRSDRDYYKMFATHNIGGRETDRNNSRRIGTTSDILVINTEIYRAADAADWTDLLVELKLLRKKVS